MSWLAKSLANSLRLDPDDDENDVVRGNKSEDEPRPFSPTRPLLHHRQQQYDDNVYRNGLVEPQKEEEEDVDSQAHGVREDLSEIKQTLTRQLWGVASFLAPPPSQPSTPASNRGERNWDQSELLNQSDQDRIVDSIEEDEEFEGENVVGITEEVLAFAGNIAMHPETWLDFPLDEEEDLDDFVMSDAQQKHAWAIERLARRLAALRIELCPCHMSESYFWKVYFVLLHSRLNKQDAETLSTSQVMEARAKWMKALQAQTKSEPVWSGRSSTPCFKNSSYFFDDDIDSVSPFNAQCKDTLRGKCLSEPTMSSINKTPLETEKQPTESTEFYFDDKPVIEEKRIIKSKDKDSVSVPSSRNVINKDEDDDDDWPEADFELDGYSGGSISVVNEEDVSFSDLEDDDFRAPAKCIVSRGHSMKDR